MVNEKGQTLVEVIVALSAVLLIIASITIAVTVSVNNASFIKNRNLANKYAQEGIETVRHLYQNQEIFFNNYSDNNFYYFMGDDRQITQGNFEVNVAGTFIRNVKFEHGVECDANDLTPNNDELKATVTVYWQSGKCGNADVYERFCHSAQLVTCFSERPVSDLTL